MLLSRPLSAATCVARSHAHFRPHHTIILALLAFLMTSLAASTTVQADGFIVVTNHDMHPLPNPHHHRRYPFAPLEVRSHHVDVKITDQIATTTVDQVFYNPGGRDLEGTYMFPIPKGAQIDRFTMDINGTMTEAELLDADKARKIYTDIVRSMKDPALLEYVGQGMFKMRIFPIEARKEKRVTITYTQVLKQDGAMIDYTYPLNTEKFSAAPIQSLSLKVAIESTTPINNAYSPTHTVELTRENPRHAVVGFEATNVLPREDFRVIFSRQQDNDDPVGLTLLTHRVSEGEDGYFMLLASPQTVIDDDEITPKDIVFVVDTSGSMAGPKLRQAKAAMRFCIENLNDGDRFDVVRFSTESHALFGDMTPFNDESREQANVFIEKLKAIGGTAIDDALRQSMNVVGRKQDGNQLRPTMVVFLTDGKPTIGQTRVDQIIANVSAVNSTSPCRVFCFGVGTSINTHLLDGIAEETRASTQYVHPEEDIEIKVSNFYTRIDSPVLANPTLAAKGVAIDRLHPRALPDVFKGEQIIVLGRYTGDGDAIISMTGGVQGESRTITTETSFDLVNTGNDFLPRMWATRRVGFLLDQIRLNGENEELREEVTRLARLHGIVTPYTAYLIVEDERRRGIARDRQVMLNIPQAGRRFMADAYYSYQVDSSGDDAVRASEATAALKSAGQPSAPPAGAAGGQRRGGNDGGGGGYPRSGGGRDYDSLGRDVFNVDGESGSDADRRIMQYVDGRTFFRQGQRWIDAIAQDLPEDAPVVNIDFGSDAYFDLLIKHPTASKWLALSNDIDIVFNKTIYRITPPAKEDDGTADAEKEEEGDGNNSGAN